ncbi:hypothetical protein I862_01960 [endosymbiont of Acanthamoeba sp. UWC8]|uniref:DUF3630 family protein n=1 Tax=endosymbiont of Acanthamoeba sp. UWC8 TaxID=86106 RepID=UPI0004D19BF0|nr:DUF3630 family protein [endosymbiont of Acanthamoeba sp. UWC8]AIF80955.1 hypothetical protein I862_01960 [endosymbiont of Acanthamoeba sp. UWC8]
MEQFYDKNNKLNIKLSEVANDQLFIKIADIIIQTIGATIIEKLDGIDQRYWDFKLGKAKFCLHQEHYLGIIVYSLSEDVNEIIYKLCCKVIDILRNDKRI